MRFDLQLFGSSNNAASQNAAAQQQIQQNTAQAAQQIQNWMKQNPYPITMQSGAQAPTQTNTTFGGQQFGGMRGTATPGMRPLAIPTQTPPLVPPNNQAPQMPAPGQGGGNAVAGGNNLIQALRSAGLI